MTEEEKEAREILNNTEWEGFMITIKNLIQKQDTKINKLKQENEQLKSDLGYTRKIIYTGDHIPRID